MFGLLAKRRCLDPQLGTLTRSRGLWRGELELDGAPVPLALAGDARSPDPVALAEAHLLPRRLQDWRTAIAQALFHHYEPYADAADAGAAPTTEPLPRIASLADVAAHVQMEFIHVAPDGGGVITELGFSTAWDTEHMVGLRFRDGRLQELCGSTLPP